MSYDEFVMGMALGALVVALVMAGANAASASIDRQVRISRARLAAQRARGDRQWRDQAEQA